MNLMLYLDYNWIEGRGCAGEEESGSNDRQERASHDFNECDEQRDGNEKN